MAEERMLNDEILLGLIKANSGGGGGGTTDYEDLDNKPQIGGVTLSGNKSLSDLGVQEKLTAGMYININSGTISVKRDVSEDVDEVLTLTHDTSGGTNKINAVLTVGGETIDSDTFTTAGGTFHDMVQISFNTRAVRFMFKYLVASKTQSAGYENYIYNEYTDTFVETIGEESKLIIKSEMDSALSDKQDTLTFDSVPTNGSTNPVESNGVYDALATKQDATDNSLETEAKTIVGAINENAGDIGSLKSGLTTLDDEVNGDATTYPYADVITIEDAIPANLADCSVKIEPVQDLHGYDKPWVGGAGKNKCQPRTTGTTFNGITVTPNEDGSISYVGTATITGTIRCQEPLTIRLKAGTYTKSINTNDIQSAIQYGGNEYTNDTFTLDVDTDVCLVVQIVEGVTYNSKVYPQIETGSMATTWEPWSNICPITGHTEASVEVTDGDETTKTYTIALGDTIYGGTVDFDSGVMTVTMAQIASYDGETIGEPWISDRDVYAAGTTPTTGAQVVYTLATPTTIQLTPQQIQLLQGTNTLTASTGQISVTVNGVSGSIGAVQTQANNTDSALAELADKLPTAPTTDGAYVLTVTVANGTPTYSWESAT